MTDINWLPLSLRKNIDLPKVIWEPMNDQYGGYYTAGTKELVIVEDPLRVGATIAHEYCHYLQYTRGDKVPGGGLDLFEKHSYNKAVRLYFRTMWWEMEALLLEHKLCKNEINHFWLKALVLPSDKDFIEDICI